MAYDVVIDYTAFHTNVRARLRDLTPKTYIGSAIAAFILVWGFVAAKVSVSWDDPSDAVAFVLGVVVMALSVFVLLITGHMIRHHRRFLLSKFARDNDLSLKFGDVTGFLIEESIVKAEGEVLGYGHHFWRRQSNRQQFSMEGNYRSHFVRIQLLWIANRGLIKDSGAGYVGIIKVGLAGTHRPMVFATTRMFNAFMPYPMTLVRPQNVWQPARLGRVNDFYVGYDINPESNESVDANKLETFLSSVNSIGIYDVEVATSSLTFFARDGFEFSEAGFRKIFQLIDAAIRFDV